MGETGKSPQLDIYYLNLTFPIRIIAKLSIDKINYRPDLESRLRTVSLFGRNMSVLSTCPRALIA